MAKTCAAIPVAALGAAAVLAADRAFVSVGAPRTPAAASSAIAQAPATAAPSLFSNAASGVAVAALAAGATLAAKSSRGNRVAARAAAVDADDKEFHKHEYRKQAALTEKFAGGLIGGESAFQSFDFNFDPLGLSWRAPYFLPWYREAELKHGRIAMLAWVGLVVPEVVRIPGPEPCYTASVIEAHQRCSGFPTDNLEDGGYYWEGPLFQIYAFCLIIELTTTLAKCTQEDGLSLENAGDYRLGINFLPEDPEKAKEMKLKELKNGRLAMLAFGGAITQAVLTGNGFPWLY